MDARLTRGIVLAIIGGGLIWFGKGITEVSTDDKVMGNAMIVGLILGFYVVVLALTSLYDFATRPPQYD
jgi:uncharacterized membrane protein